jgi:hypothetical protein
VAAASVPTAFARAALSPGSAGARARPVMEEHSGRPGKYPFVLVRNAENC